MLRPVRPCLHRLSATRLAHRQDGVAAVEFAMIAPIFLMTLMGIFDLSYNIYTSAMLEGSIQKAARDSSIEAASDVVDDRVKEAVHMIVPDAVVTVVRRSSNNYANVARPEDYTDIDADGLCNNGEPYEDANGNGQWDVNPANTGTNGMGGARDAVLYEVTVTYDRAFPIAGFVPGMPQQVTTVARTVLRNQPYDRQAISLEVGAC